MIVSDYLVNCAWAHYPVLFFLIWFLMNKLSLIGIRRTNDNQFNLRK